MKKLRLNLQVLLLISLFTAAFSCTDNKEADGNFETDSVSEIQLSSEIDNLTGVVEDLIISVYETDVSLDNGRSAFQDFPLPTCISITKVLQTNFREITIDFGNGECEFRGHNFSGIIKLSFERDINQKSVLINYLSEDFYVDNIYIEGQRSLLRELNNGNGKPQFTRTLNIKVTWPNGDIAERSGTKVREWIEGFNSGYFSDNVFEISGEWNTTFRSGNSHSYIVVAPLRREMVCRFFVSGTISVQRTNFQGILDYGEGCDNKAVFTFNNGNSREITLN